MPASKKDPLAIALDASLPRNHGNTTTKVDHYFGDRPDVLDSIRRARQERHLSYKTIAQVLSQEDGVHLSDGAVKNWLSKQGIA